MSATDEKLDLTMSTAMRSASHYHNYQWDLVSPFLGDRISEIGIGFGQYTQRMVEAGKDVLACDLDVQHLDDVSKLISSDHLRTLQLNLESPGAAMKAFEEFRPDTTILLNVLEHVSDHVGALRFLNDVTVEGGKLVLIVPALGWIFNGLDRQAGHYRRYNRSMVQSVFSDSGWTVKTCRYINAPGIPGWVAAGLLAKISNANNELDAASTNGLIRLYDRWFVCLSRISDPLIRRIAGLSVFAVAEKQTSA